MPDYRRYGASELAPPTTFEDAVDRTLGDIRRVLISKHRDYGPGNIEGAGERGVQIRLMDKVRRAMNILDSDRRTIERIREITRWVDPSDMSGDDAVFCLHEIVGVIDSPAAENETIEDTYIDEAGYAVIALMLHRGLWSLPFEKGGR